MVTIAVCDECTWTAEADDRRDAQQAAANHYDAAHAPEWCGLCGIPGPATKRNDHDECISTAIEAEIYAQEVTA